MPHDSHGAETRRSNSAALTRCTQDGWEVLDNLASGLTRQRTEILLHLARGDVRVNDLADELDLSRNDVSYHLRPLRELGLVEFQRHGRELVYRLGPNIRVLRRGLDVALRLAIPGVCMILVRVADGGRSNLVPRIGGTAVVVTRSAAGSAPPEHAR